MINVASNLWYFYDAYIVCFCTEGDLLSQWRGYARPGGYSIGLDPNTFPHTTLTNLDLIPVRYDANAHVERVRELVKRWRVAFRFGYDTASDIARRLGLVFATALTRTAVTFKHPAFHEEREWRLVLPRLQVETEAGPGHSVRYRARDGLILPYLPIDLVPGPEGNSPARLREIVVGPNREPVLANLALKRYLLHLGYPAASFPVTTSAAPLRT